MSINIYLKTDDKSVDLDQIIEKNQGYELWEIVEAIEDYTITKCSLVALNTKVPADHYYGADALCNFMTGTNAASEAINKLKYNKPINVITNPDVVKKEHVLRIEGQENVCIDCGKRWDFDDANVPECN